MGVRTFYRILWTCFKRERLAAFIDGKTVAIDVSVMPSLVRSGRRPGNSQPLSSTRYFWLPTRRCTMVCWWTRSCWL